MTLVTVVARPVESQTAALTILDRATIAASGARTVAELLRYAPGVHVASHGTRGGLTAVQVRGGDPNFTLVLMDGAPLNDVTDPVGGTVNLEALPTAGIERIEIARGPASHFHGSAAMAGVINIVTRGGVRGGSAARMEGGDASLRRGTVTVAGGTEARHGALSLSWEEEGRRVADETFDQLNLYGRVGLPVGQRSRLVLNLRGSAWDAEDYPEASGGPGEGSGALRRSEHEETTLGLLWSHEGPGRRGRHQVRGTLSRHRLDRESPGVFPLVPPALEDTRYTETLLGWTGSWRRGPRDQFSLGVDLEREAGRNHSTLLLPAFLGGPVAGDYRITRETAALFGEWVLERGRATVEAGARLDWAEGFAREWGARLGVLARWREGKLRLRGSAGRAFKLPSFFALASPPALGGNPALGPETALGVDLGVERAFPAIRLTTGVTLFTNRFADLVDFDFDTFLHVNRSRVRARGAEWSLAWEATDRLRIAADLTWKEVEDRATGMTLRHRPRWVGSLRLRWRPAATVTVWLDGHWVSRRRDEQIPAPARETVAGYGLGTLAGTWRLAPGVALEGRIDNLADRDYETAIGFPGPGRAFRLALRFGLDRGGSREP